MNILAAVLTLMQISVTRISRDGKLLVLQGAVIFLWCFIPYCHLKWQTAEISLVVIKWKISMGKY